MLMGDANVSNGEIHGILTPEKRETWSRHEFWADFAPDLTVAAHEFSLDEDGVDGKPSAKTTERSKLHDDLVRDGYTLVDQMSKGDQARFDELTKKLKDGIAALHEKDVPATFILLYDETWEYARFGKHLLENGTHQANVFNFDMLAWYIDPKESAAGFSPHRDRQPEETSYSFHPDNQAKYVTLWTALSRATPENSCLYIIPKSFDPGYSAGDGDEDPLRCALSTKESYQHIRALPREPGESVMFTHRILHWGSRGNKNTCKEPRIAISFVSSDPSFERPYVNPNYFAGDRIPPFRIRLLLVCAQLLIYYQRFNLPKACIRACYEYCKEHENELDPTYRGKVGVEFVKAMKESTAGSHHQNGSSEPALSCADSIEDEEREAMLEEMLEAEEKGIGEFQDDYDDLDPEETNFSDSSDGLAAEDEEDDEEDADEGALFGKRSVNDHDDDNPSKRAKV